MNPFTRGHRARPRPRHQPGHMNKTEQAYANRLELLLRSGEIRRWGFESIKFRLADRTFYTPDFMVVTDAQIEFHEVKGYWEDDARTKIKVVAELFTEFAFFAVQKQKDGWIIEEF
jgi:hypothetical protein